MATGCTRVFGEMVSSVAQRDQLEAALVYACGFQSRRERRWGYRIVGQPQLFIPSRLPSFSKIGALQFQKQFPCASLGTKPNICRLALGLKVAGLAVVNLKRRRLVAHVRAYAHAQRSRVYIRRSTVFNCWR